MRESLHETLGPVFELFRHFLLRFFDSDLITATEHTPAALVGALSIVMMWMFLFLQPMKMKYEQLSKLPVPGPYREALRADELWLITLTMAAIGLATAIKWQALFPNLRDYQALAGLPLRPSQLFTAKLVALLTISAAVVVSVGLAPGLMFPALSDGRWALNASAGARALANFSACAAGGYFLFFGLMALQGLLLNLLPPPLFGRVTGALQGILVAGMLMLLVLSFSIGPRVTAAVIEPPAARWLPPVWFLGVNHSLLGDPDPAIQALAHRAVTALAIAIFLTLTTYVFSYRRYRVLLVEGMPRAAANRRWAGRALERLLPNPRQQAVASFILKTLAASSQHHMILAAYCGFGVAVLLTGMPGLEKLFPPERLVAAYFVYSHVILLAFLLIGLRHLFSLPTELAANWTFRIVERQGRRDWMRAVDRLLLFGAAVILLVPLPMELRLFGGRALAELILFAAFAVLCYELAFASWQKLPFTCSYLPAKAPAWIVTLRLFGLLLALPAVSGAIVACLYSVLAYAAALLVVLSAGRRVHKERRATWGELPLQYEELPDPDIHGLDLLR